MKTDFDLVVRVGLLPAALVFLLICSGQAGEAEQKTAPQNPSTASLVRQALESELAGQNDRREALLRAALEQSPDSPAAHWQLGEVRGIEKDVWLTPSQIELAAQKDRLLAEYRKQRDATGPTLPEMITLARWCQKNKLENEERVHWLLVLQMQPDYPEALIRLDLQQRRGPRSPVDQNAPSTKPQNNGQTPDSWRSFAAKWRQSLDGGESLPPAELRERVANISDRGEMLALQQAIAQEAGAKKQKLHPLTLALAQTLNDNPHPAAAECLAHLAVLSEWKDVCSTAVVGLKRHPLDHYAPLLLAALQTPLEGDIQFDVDGNGNLITHSNIYREGALADLSVSNTLSPITDPTMPYVGSISPGIAKMDAPGDIEAWKKRLPATQVTWLDKHPEVVAAWQQREKVNYANAQAYNQADASRLRLKAHIFAEAMRAEAVRQSNLMASQAIAARKAAAFHNIVERTNKTIEENNAKITNVLNQTTGMELGENPMEWWKWWWQEYNETYSVRSLSAELPGDAPDPGEPYAPDPSKPIMPYELYETYRGVSPSHTSFADAPASFQSTSPFPSPSSCFAPGTIVWTQMGRWPIEKIKVGDRVLAQNTETGELAYKSVLGITTRKPGPRIKIGLGSETITATPGHPFWVDGKAWQLTKHLQVGQFLHSISGAAPIESLEKQETDRSWTGYSYNLIVADFNDYFVGEKGILVHGNLPRRPTSMRIPGLPAQVTVAEQHVP